MRHLLLIIFSLFITATQLNGQNVFGVTGGYGSGSENIYPAVEGRTVYGLKNFGISWRNYTAEKYVGCFGIDLEFLQRGFSYAPYASTYLEGEEMFYYTRKINSLVLPIVWQPYVYMFERRVRVFFEAAATFSYDISSTYKNDYALENDLYSSGFEGDYDYQLTRDNRLGYGLAFGGGLAYLIGRYEIMARVRYYWGLSDVVRNRNKYYTNNMDGAENPFDLTPIRSPLNNVMINFGVGYRFDFADGFKAWSNVKIKAPKINDGFNYKGVTTDDNKKKGRR